MPPPIDCRPRLESYFALLPRLMSPRGEEFFGRLSILPPGLGLPAGRLALPPPGLPDGLLPADGLLPPPGLATAGCR